MQKYYKPTPWTRLFDVLNVLIMLLFMLTIVFPFWNQLCISFSDVSTHPVSNITVYPLGFNTEAYEKVFSDMRIVRAAGISLLRVGVGTIGTLFCTGLLAYICTIQWFSGRKFIRRAFVLTMYFSAGLIPTYLAFISIGLYNTFWVYIIPGLFSAYYMLIISSYIQSMPDALSEAARIDGAGEMKIYMQVIVPISIPVFAAIAVYCAVDQWNAWFDTTIYVPNGEWDTLQIYLRPVSYTHLDVYKRQELYCEDNGRPSCDPVVIFKLDMIKHLFGIRSLRQTLRDAEVNVAYRWFLGYTMTQHLPHFATVSYTFRHRFTPEVIETIFRWILEEIAQAGYLEPKVVFVDGTHIKANANLKKHIKKSIPKAAKRYQEQLLEEVDADRENHGKKPLRKDDDHPEATEEKSVIESTTDPDSGVFHKGEHKKCFAYEAHTMCEKHGYVMEVEVTPGNVHDSVAFDAVFERATEHYPEIEVVTADAGYKTPWICKQIIDSGRIPSLPYKRPMTKKDNLPWYEYVYDEYYDCVLCPQYHVLSYSTTNREGYREYKSKRYVCQDCPVREQCTQNQQCTKTVIRHIWQDYIEPVSYTHLDVYKRQG